MRLHIIQTLLHKELLRHAANRAGLALALLLVAAAMLLSFFRTDESPAAGLLGGLNRCYVDYWQRDAWIQHLENNLPDNLGSSIRFRYAGHAPTHGGTLVYEAGAGAIQVRPGDRSGNYLVWFWHPGSDAGVIAPFEAWFWKESQKFFRQKSDQVLKVAGVGPLPDIEDRRSRLHGSLDTRTAIASALVLFALFFVCIYLLPSLTCEERERGVLLAQALSPASPQEILAAKFIFYPAVGVALAALLAGLYSPAVLLKPFFWIALLVASFGAMGVGLVISSLARTQRNASMGALCYMLAVALLLLVCQQNRIPLLPYVALEYHCPRIINAVLSDAVNRSHWLHLMGAAVLAFCWGVAATELFRKRGWQ